MLHTSIGKSFDTHGTDKSFNLTEYYALKSVKLSDSYMVQFWTYKSKKEKDANKNIEYYKQHTDTKDPINIFYCENVKIPTIKNVIHKSEIGSMGHRFAAFEQKPFDDISMTLIEDDKSSVYKFIMSRITMDYLPYRHLYYYNKDEYNKMDCIITIYDNALNEKKAKMIVNLNECRIVSYNTSTFNSNDTSTPYTYTINLSYNAILYEFP